MASAVNLHFSPVACILLREEARGRGRFSMGMSEKMKEKLERGAEIAGDAIGKGMEAAGKALGKAGGAVQEFGDRSAAAIDRKRVERERDRKIAELGRVAADAFIKDKRGSLDAGDESVAALTAEIERMEAEMARLASLAEKKPAEGAD